MDEVVPFIFTFQRGFRMCNSCQLCILQTRCRNQAVPQVSGLPTDPFTGPGKEVFGGTICFVQYVLMASEHLQAGWNCASRRAY